jgi:hypothetical protein
MALALFILNAPGFITGSHKLDCRSMLTLPLTFIFMLELSQVFIENAMTQILL